MTQICYFSGAHFLNASAVNEPMTHILSNFMRSICALAQFGLKSLPAFCRAESVLNAKARLLYVSSTINIITIYLQLGRSHLNFSILNMGISRSFSIHCVKYGNPYLGESLVYRRNCPYIRLFRQTNAIAIEMFAHRTAVPGKLC